jgi:hypothetical protein
MVPVEEGTAALLLLLLLLLLIVPSFSKYQLPQYRTPVLNLQSGPVTLPSPEFQTPKDSVSTLYISMASAQLLLHFVPVRLNWYSSPAK